jgi:hypothetical protein
MNPAVILLAAFFTGATSWSIGLLALHALRVRMHRQEALIIAYVLGSAGLSLVVFAMLAMWVARPWAFALIGLVSILACIWRRAWRIDGGPELSPVPRVWRWVFGILMAVYGTYTFAHAMAPDISPDGIAYHLGTVGRWFRAGGLEWHTTNMYANMPMGIEMLFVFAFSFGRHSAAALVHWQLYLVLPFLLLNLGRRFKHPVAGAVAGLLVFLSPIVSVDGSSSYVDVGAASVVVALFSLLLLFERDRDRNVLIPIGALGGFAYACKMTAFPALPFAMAYVAWVVRPRRVALQPVLTVALTGMAFIAPWLIKNALMTGNPFSPFLNRVFPNPYVRINFEDEYRTMHRNYYGKIASWSEIPKEVTVKGASLQGLLGPVFLLAPAGLVALRWPLGRRALLAALVFGAAYPSNIGTRFLMLSLPFVSLAMALVFSQWRGTAAAVVVFHALMSWPDVVPAYADLHAWHLYRFRWREALRIEPEDAFYERYAPTVMLARLIDQKVPENGRVLTYGAVAEAYTSRDILVVYQAGFNNLLGEILVAGMSPVYQGSHKWMFRFDPVRVRRLRLVQTRSLDQPWSVSEMRIYSGGGGEFPRNHAWRIKAAPNPWEVQLAFDNCAITKWMTWQPARPGDFVETDLGQPLEVAAVGVEAPPDHAKPALRVEAEMRPGVWKTLSSEARLLSTEPVINSRLTATNDLERFGVTHLAIANDDFIAQDLYLNQKAWGIAVVGEVSGSRLYKLN